MTGQAAAACRNGGGSEILSRCLAGAAVLAGWLAVVLVPRLEATGGLSVALLGAWWVAVVLVIRSDLRDFMIPDAASAAIAGLGLVNAVAGATVTGLEPAEAAAAGAEAVANGAATFVLFWLVAWTFKTFRNRDALGFGDVKLAGASAIWLAPADGAVALEIAALGALAMLVLGHRDRGGLAETAVPFGAFLAPAPWLVVVFGPAVHDWLASSPW